VTGAVHGFLGLVVARESRDGSHHRLLKRVELEGGAANIRAVGGTIKVHLFIRRVGIVVLLGHHGSRLESAFEVSKGVAETKESQSIQAQHVVPCSAR